ncbi:hypothetical protein Tco_0848861 [Tanacetum coccineum]
MNPRDHVNSISTIVEADTTPVCRIGSTLIFNEFIRLSGINDDLFTYEIEVPKPTPCVEQRTSDPTHNDLGDYEWKISYEECEKIYVEAVIFVNKRLIRLIDVTVEQWLDLKYGDHKTMDKKCQERGDDEVILSNKEVSDLKDEYNDDKHEITEIFRIETNFFEYETSLCIKFNKFNDLLIIDTELFTHDIQRTETYEDYKNELNNELDVPWSKNGIPYEICDHICEPFCFKNGKTKWPTCNSNENGFRNGGELLGMVRVSYMTYFHDNKWYDDLMDSSLKEEALKQKAIYEKSWGNATQKCWWKINDHECNPIANWRDHIRGTYANVNTTHDPYLDGRNGRASYNSNVQEKEEQHKTM